MVSQNIITMSLVWHKRQGIGFVVSGFPVWGFGLWGLRFRVWGFEFRVWDVVFEVYRVWVYHSLEPAMGKAPAIPCVWYHSTLSDRV